MFQPTSKISILGCGVDECNKFDDNNANKNFNDYLFIGASYRKQDAQNANGERYILASYFCGSGLGRDQSGTNTNQMVDGTDDGTGIISDGPFVLTFHADKNPGSIAADSNQNPNNAMSAQNELGFSLDYRISTSCPDLIFAT